jgi:HK97 gp10 family phage protein
MARCRVVIDNSASIKAEFREKVAAATAKAALDTEAQAKASAPVDTGFLRSSIQAVKQALFSWIVGVTAAYGNYVEMGTYKAPAQPYLMPAFQKVLRGYLAALRSIRTRGMRNR